MKLDQSLEVCIACHDTRYLYIHFIYILGIYIFILLIDIILLSYILLYIGYYYLIH